MDEATRRYGSHSWVALAAQTRAELAAAGNTQNAINHYKQARAGFLEANNEYAAAQCEESLANLED